MGIVEVVVLSAKTKGHAANATESGGTPETRARRISKKSGSLPCRGRQHSAQRRTTDRYKLCCAGVSREYREELRKGMKNKVRATCTSDYVSVHMRL